MQGKWVVVEGEGLTGAALEFFADGSMVGTVQAEGKEVTLKGRVQVVYLCTSRDCWNLFIATYGRVGTHRADYPDERFRYRAVAPWKPEETKFPDEIDELSPTFVQVFNETKAAEGLGLTNLVGMGLRKALEFLIKDFAIKSHPADEEKILKAQLGSVIDTYCDDAKLKATAKRATWLGNDETHYERVWQDQDVENLKVLIRLTVGWVEREVLTSRYVEDMPDKKNPASS